MKNPENWVSLINPPDHWNFKMTDSERARLGGSGIGPKRWGHLENASLTFLGGGCMLQELLRSLTSRAGSCFLFKKYAYCLRTCKLLLSCPRLRVFIDRCSACVSPDSFKNTIGGRVSLDLHSGHPQLCRYCRRLVGA